MVSNRSSRRGSDTIPPEAIDRLLIGACAAIWLVLLGVSVAAAVALADLGRGFHRTSAGGAHATSVLYVVIIVSALIIAGAVPMLLRARRMSSGRPVPQPTAGAASGPAGAEPRAGFSAVTRAPGERMRQHGTQAADSAAEWSGEAVDRVWLRGTVVLVGTMGTALVAVAAATYLMAVGHDGASWGGYGLAGAVTAAMPAVEFLHVRQLRRLVAGSG